MLSAVFARLQRLVDPIVPPAGTPPPARLWPFLAAHLKDVRGPLLVVLGFSVLDAVFDAILPYFLGRILDMLATIPRERLVEEGWPVFMAMLATLLVIRPGIFIAGYAFARVGVEPGWQSRMRWQFFSRIARQSLTFFQNDFAGRLANRVMQSGGAIRQATMSAIQSVVYIGAYGLGAFGLIGAQDWRMAMPILVWSLLYMLLLRHFLPHQRVRAQAASEGRSLLMGRIVDAFGNIQTLKLFGERARDDAYMAAAVREANALFQAQQRLQVGFSASLVALSATTLSATAAIGIALYARGLIEVGAFAMAMTLVLTLLRASNWIAWEIAGIMENIGIVQEGMESIAAPVALLDRPDARPLIVTQGAVAFEGVTFGYGRSLPVVHDMRFTVAAGEKVGLVGRSGAGKSTLVNLLLRFHDPDSGHILVDGQDIAGVTQDSLRRRIAMVTQDTALLHRSIAENIAYGRPDATMAEIIRAAEEAHAADFIPHLSDWKGRRGYDAHVGERGVKLSGGQRQRIALARVILKDAPILVLDEATSALDSEVEAAIQENLERLMRGKTVIAIAHRLSTLQAMDRLIVIDSGRIIEEGNHRALLALGGLYADLWSRQSGGFLAAAAPAGAA
ncbi:ABC transporter ATP-binding protein [Rhabdaerophilum calidifontis]|uniref:ABC transporter ATP-binding protein n=1 Tax=Rhabdaerophilum calidifontis TaxID=2604328 RepID=UPI0012396753|nr:ABC transporter ATP-binding protein [Rhabdaerophilum calidifontis]